MRQEIEGPLGAPELWLGGGIGFMLEATDSIREPQVGGRRCWPGAQEFVECRLSLPGWRRGEEVEVVSHDAVRQMKCSECQGRFRALLRERSTHLACRFSVAPRSLSGRSRVVGLSGEDHSAWPGTHGLANWTRPRICHHPGADSWQVPVAPGCPHRQWCIGLTDRPAGDRECAVPARLGAGAFVTWTFASGTDEPQLISLFPATRMGPSVNASLRASPSAIARSSSGSGT